MKLIKLTDTLTVSTETYSNSQAWGHEVKAFYNGYEIEINRVRYHNRTWEAFQYQSALQGLLGKLERHNGIPPADMKALREYIKTGTY
jgi:hypothetical protein